MKAVQLFAPGPTSNLRPVDLPQPKPKPNEVLIRVKAFGLNHSELATRLGEPNPLGDVPLPHTLGIECVGVVEEVGTSATSKFAVGNSVMAALGGLGRNFNGSYAEFCAVPMHTVMKIPETCGLGWETLAALPVLLQTAWGSLFRALKLVSGETLLVRGASSAIGLIALQMAKDAGSTVVATTRRESKRTQLLAAGADHVLIDTADTQLPVEIQKEVPGGVNKALELVGTATLLSTIKCLADGGICCSVGTLGGSWSVPNLIPALHVPMGRYLTSYAHFVLDERGCPMAELLAKIEQKKFVVDGAGGVIGRVFTGLEGVIEAHDVMERHEMDGKGVVVL